MKTSRIRVSSIARHLGVVSVCVALLLVSGASAARRTRPNRPITNPKFDPNAESVELFAGIEKGLLDAKMIPKNSKGGNLFIENKTDKPLTVQMPKAFVGVHVLKQGGEPGEGASQAGGGGGGGAQAVGGGGGGGGFGGGGGGFGGGGFGGGGYGGGPGSGGLGGGGAGFFSIPPEKTVRLPYHSVCLQHGKTEPSPRMNYRMRKVKNFTKDPALQELIQLVGTNRIHPQIAQAAAWHLSNDMSWRQLASKRIKRLGGAPSIPYFSAGQLYQAQRLTTLAVEKSKKSNPDAVTTKPRTPIRRPRRIR